MAWCTYVEHKADYLLLVGVEPLDHNSRAWPGGLESILVEAGPLEGVGPRMHKLYDGDGAYTQHFVQRHAVDRRAGHRGPQKQQRLVRAWSNSSPRKGGRWFCCFEVFAAWHSHCRRHHYLIADLFFNRNKSKAHVSK